MKVLVVNASGADLRQGGTERHIARMLRAFPDRGVAVHCLAAFPSVETQPAGISTLHRSTWQNSLSRRALSHLGMFTNHPWRRYERLIASLNPDVINTHNLPGIGTGVWRSAQKMGIPVVHSIHDYQFHCRRASLMTDRGRACSPTRCGCNIRRRSLLRHDSAVSHLVSGTDFAMSMHAGMFPGAGRTVIPNPMPTDPLTAQPPSAALRNVGYIGSLHANKGVPLLLELAPNLQALGLTLHIAGAGPLRRAVDDAHTRGDLKYWGPLGPAEKPRFFGCCDAGLIPSVWLEPGGPPNVLLEWLHARRPILSTTRGCLGDLREHTKGVCWLPPTTEAFLSALAALCDPHRWKEQVSRVAAPQLAQTEDAWLDAYLDLFRRVAR